MKCSNCGTPYKINDAVCDKCGHVLFDTRVNTVSLQVDPSLLRLRHNRAVKAAEGEQDSARPEKAVSLLIRGMAERFIFEEGTEIILGRTDLLSSDPGHFDLTRYGGHDRGVSRSHAVLRFNQDQLMLTDLNSSNGTFINAQKLKPNEPRALKHGDEIMLGSLSVVIRFE